MRIAMLSTFFAATVALTLWGCAGGKDGDKAGEPVESSGSSGGGGDDDEGGASASSTRVTFVNSLTNNPLTSFTVSSNKADALAEKFAGGKEKRQLEGKVSADRLARKSLPQVVAAAKRLAEQEMEKAAGRTIGDEVKLELALAAVTNKNFALAEYYLQSLIESKNARIKAGAYNALGVVALRDDRVPEAVLYFREALRAAGNYKPAMVNLGFTALRGGDLSTAKKMLADLSDDWFIAYGLISVARLEGNADRAINLCEKVLDREPNHRGALANCALVESQNRGNFEHAKKLVARALQARGGETDWDERLGRIETRVDYEEAVHKAAEAKKKADTKGKGQGGTNEPAASSPGGGDKKSAPAGP